MKKECDFAIFNFKKQDEKLAGELCEYLDKNAKKIYDFFEIQPSSKAIINIIPTKKEYDTLYRKNNNLPEDEKIPSWAIGCRADNGEIYYVSLQDYKNTSHAFEQKDFEKALDYYKKTILHEFVHFVNLQYRKIKNCSHTETWLSEGLAVYLSGQKDDKVFDDFDYSLEQLMPQKHFASCYDGWFLITKYLVENYSKQKVFDLIESNRQAREFLEDELYTKVKNFYLKQEK